MFFSLSRVLLGRLPGSRVRKTGLFEIFQRMSNGCWSHRRSPRPVFCEAGDAENDNLARVLWKNKCAHTCYMAHACMCGCTRVCVCVFVCLIDCQRALLWMSMDLNLCMYVYIFILICVCVRVSVTCVNKCMWAFTHVLVAMRAISPQCLRVSVWLSGRLQLCLTRRPFCTTLLGVLHPSISSACQELFGVNRAGHAGARLVIDELVLWLVVGLVGWQILQEKIIQPLSLTLSSVFLHPSLSIAISLRDSLLFCPHLPKSALVQSPFVSVYLCIYLSVHRALSLSLSLSVSFAIPFTPLFCLSLSFFLSFFSLALSPPLSLSLFLSFSLSLSLYVSLSLSLSLSCSQYVYPPLPFFWPLSMTRSYKSLEDRYAQMLSWPSWLLHKLQVVKTCQSRKTACYLLPAALAQHISKSPCLFLLCVFGRQTCS